MIFPLPAPICFGKINRRYYCTVEYPSMTEVSVQGRKRPKQVGPNHRTVADLIADSAHEDTPIPAWQVLKGSKTLLKSGHFYRVVERRDTLQRLIGFELWHPNRPQRITRFTPQQFKNKALRNYFKHRNYQQASRLPKPPRQAVPLTIKAPKKGVAIGVCTLANPLPLSVLCPSTAALYPHRGPLPVAGFRIVPHQSINGDHAVICTMADGGPSITTPFFTAPRGRETEHIELEKQVHADVFNWTQTHRKI